MRLQASSRSVGIVMKQFPMQILKLLACCALALGTVSASAEPATAGINAETDTVSDPASHIIPIPTDSEPVADEQPLMQSLSEQDRQISDLPVSHIPVKTQDMTVHAPDIWARMRRGFSMPDLASPVVNQQLAALTAHPKSVQTILERGRKYLYHIVVELEKRGMPTELALLPLVESAYNPMAFSSAKAAGLWQFIPSTGRDFSLEQNWWVDERRDILASTSAALQYLQAVYEMQGDWHLALASYNWGENAVMRAVQSNRNAGKSTDFNSLTLPRETAQYVPKFEAIKMIVAHPERYGITLPNIPNEPYFVTVERTQAMDVAVAARLAEMPLSEFQALNPAYNRPVIPGNHSADLLLPVENAKKFRENLAQHPVESLMNWKTYALPRSAYVEQIASRLKIGLDTLRSANGLPAHARLAAGYTLLVPDDTNTDAPEKDIPARSVRGHKPPQVLTSGSVRRQVTQNSKARSTKGQVAQSNKARPRS